MEEMQGMLGMKIEPSEEITIDFVGRDFDKSEVEAEMQDSLKAIETKVEEAQERSINDVQLGYAKVYMNSGGVLEGEITKISDQELVIKISSSSSAVIKRERVKKIKQ